MLDAGYESEIMKGIHLLDRQKQRSVLLFVRNLLKKKNNKNLINLAGSISSEDIKLMEEAINKGCENIDSNEW